MSNYDRGFRVKPFLKEWGVTIMLSSLAGVGVLGVRSCLNNETIQEQNSNATATAWATVHGTPTPQPTETPTATPEFTEYNESQRLFFQTENSQTITLSVHTNTIDGQDLLNAAFTEAKGYELRSDSRDGNLVVELGNQKYNVSKILIFTNIPSDQRTLLTEQETRIKNEEVQNLARPLFLRLDANGNISPQFWEVNTVDFDIKSSQILTTFRDGGQIKSAILEVDSDEFYKESPLALVLYPTK